MKIDHIRKAREFSEIFKTGQKIPGRRICLYVGKADDKGVTSVGIVLSRKCEPKAVRRNYIRRRTYQFFKEESGKMAAGAKVIVWFREPFYEKRKQAVSQILKEELERSVKKAGIL